MSRTILALMVALALILPAAPGHADTATFETITVSSTAVGISDSTLNPTYRPRRVRCLITSETAQIRWRTDGTAPTSTVGHPLDAPGKLRISGYSDLVRFQAIRTGGSDATLSVTCW